MTHFKMSYMHSFFTLLIQFKYIAMNKGYTLIVNIMYNSQCFDIIKFIDACVTTQGWLCLHIVVW